jgi:hypothetical protein
MTERAAPVRVRGRIGGVAVDASGIARLEGDRLLIASADGTSLSSAVASWTGLRVMPDEVVCLLPGGDALTLARDAEPADFAAFGETLRARAFALPEVTRALRAYGSRRGNPGSDHDRFFAPLVGPLRAARDQVARGDAEPWRAATMADGTVMATALRDALSGLAAERFPQHPPERRALEAELHDLAEPVTDALVVLAERAAALREASDDERLTRWRAWAAALGDAFARADRAWIAALPALADPRGGSGRLWRRVLRRGGTG